MEHTDLPDHQVIASPHHLDLVEEVTPVVVLQVQATDLLQVVDHQVLIPVLQEVVVPVEEVPEVVEETDRYLSWDSILIITKK